MSFAKSSNFFDGHSHWLQAPTAIPVLFHEVIESQGHESTIIYCEDPNTTFEENCAGAMVGL